MKKLIIFILSIFIYINILDATIVSISNKRDINNSLSYLVNDLDNFDLYSYKSNKFIYSNNTYITNNNSNNIGILNSYEYFLIGGINSYLSINDMFFVYNNNLIKTIKQSEEIDIEESNIRATFYLKNEVNVIGSGTITDPWTLVYPNYNITINITNGKLNNSTNYTEVLNNYYKEYIVVPDSSYYYIDNIENDVTCTGNTNYNFIDNKLILNNVNSDVTCNIKYTPSKYSIKLVLNNASSNENNLLVDAYTSKSINITANTNYAYTSASCTNNQNFTYNNKVFTINNITNDTVCTLNYTLVNNTTNTSNGSYSVVATGYYTIEAYGSQGNGSGGKGGYVSANVYLTKGQTLYYEVGTTTNGAASSGTGSYSGGGSTRFKLNNEYILIAAGGGGGSSGGAGGTGTGKGGTNSSDSSKNGIDGTNGSGGSSAQNYETCTSTGTCGGGCKTYDTVSSTYCKSYVAATEVCATGQTDCGDTFCENISGTTAKRECYSSCGSAGLGTTCKKVAGYCESYGTTYSTECTEYYSTYTCCTSYQTITGSSGNGGSNKISTTVNNKQVTTNSNQSGVRTSNGLIKITFKEE